MSRNTVELPGGGCATESEALSALVHEAKQRGVSYGLLVANTTERERAEIIQDNTRFEKLYPGYLMSAAEAFHNDVNGGCYLAARFYRKDGKFIKPKPKPKPKPKKQK